MRAVHRCAGLLAGVALCLLGLSGSVLVFRPELERLARPELYRVRPAGAAAEIEEMRAAAAASAPDLVLYRVRLPRGEAGSCEFYFGAGGKMTTRVYVDPYGPRVLGVRTAGSDPFLWLQSLHFDLLAGETGRRINGAIAALLLLLGLSGLPLWLRTTASWTARLRPRWRVRPARRNWGLHMAAGFWTLPFLLLMGFTGLYFAFHDPVAGFVYALTRTAPRPALPPLRGAPPAAPLDALLERARALEPGAEFTLIRLPRSPGSHATLNYVLPGDLSDLGANGIHFDPDTGTVLRVDRLREMELGPRIVASFVPLHFGTFGGMPSRVLWAGLGLLPFLFFATGLAIWRRRRSRRSAPAASSREQDPLECPLEVVKK